MATPTGTDPHHAPVPPGWPGDDPTVPEELGALGQREDGAHRPPGRGARPADPPLSAPARGEADGADHGDRHIADADLDDELADELDDDIDDELDDDELDVIAGVQPAGRVLVIMVAALVLAVLVNADALVERAERKPPGAARDRSLAVWHPVQDVSHVVQLYRVRQLADWVAGDDDTPPAGPPESARDSRRAPGSAGSPGDSPQDGAGTAAEAEADDAAAAGAGEAASTLRTPTTAEPLRLWVGGDFTAQVFGESLVAASQATDLVDPELHYESASGLTRHDYFDWPGALDEDLDAHDAEVVVVVFGANDAQGIVLADGTAAQVDDPRWAAEYGRRVGAVMDQLQSDGRMVVWVGQPPMRTPDYGARMAALNHTYATEAAGRPWVTFVDPAVVVGGPAGAYADVVTDTAGTPVGVRQPDGIHLTPAGGDLLAAHVLALVDAQVDLSGRAGDPTPD